MIENKIIGNTSTEIFSATSDTAILNLSFYNDDVAQEETLSVYIIKSGNVEDLSTKNYEFVLPHKQTDLIERKVVLSNGDKITAIGTVGNITSCTLTFMPL
jgi:hypothetical protein